MVYRVRTQAQAWERVKELHRVLQYKPHTIGHVLKSRKYVVTSQGKQLVIAYEK